MKLDALLSRADVEVLHDLIGRGGARLLPMMDAKMNDPSSLRTIAVGLNGHDQLLLNPHARGSLLPLLRLHEIKHLTQLLSLPLTGNLYTTIAEHKFRKGSSSERILFDFFEMTVPVSEAVEPPSSTLACEPVYPLFGHQRQAARELRRFLGSAPYRALLHMPTGSGKTRTAMSMVADHLRESEPRLVIWLAYSEELCGQARAEFEKAWSVLGDRLLKVYSCWGNNDFDASTAHDGLVVAGLPKAFSRARKDIAWLHSLAARCSLVVVDEAHQAVAPTYRLLLETLVVQKPNTALLGLTATPGRTWNNVAADQELSKFFHRRKVSLHVPGYPNPVDYLVAERYLARAEFTSLFYESGVRLSPADLTKINNAFDIPESILEQLAEDERRNLAIVARIEELARNHQRIIVFASSVSHSHLLATVLQARGLNSDAVTTRTPASERGRILERFKEDGGVPRILCNYGVLTTGFDAPRTSAAVIARPTKSLVLYSQMVGRAIRGERAGGNLTAEIVTVVDNILPGFGDVGAAFNNWEDVWS